jgi:pilus assembly protein CpaF
VLRSLKAQIHEELLERLDIKRLTATHIDQLDLQDRVQHTLTDLVHEVRDKLPLGIHAQDLQKAVYDEALGLGPLEDFLADPEITEIMVNGPNSIYIEKKGGLELSNATFSSEDAVTAVIERIVAPIGRRIDESQPYVDARLPDGSRVNAIISPLSLVGPCLTIRKFSKDPFTVEDLIRFGSITSEAAGFIDACVRLRKNIVVAGGTGTGKTTLLNVISSYLPETERIITIEDAAELRMSQHHVVRLESRPPNIEGRGAITIRDLVRNALRMRPDRIVVGECRGGEALDMLQAMNTGHEGSLTTVHANSPRDVISRLETMVLMSGMELPLKAIREQIGSAIHLIVQIARYSDGSRRVSRITEIVGLEGDKITMQDLFTYSQEGLDDQGKVIGQFGPTGSVPTFLDEMRSRGIQIDPALFDPDPSGT